MKQCPACRTPYYDESLKFCTKDGTPLVGGPPSGFDTQPSTLKLPAESPHIDHGRIRILLSLEIEDNLLALSKYRTQATDRGKSFKGPIGHAMVLDGFRYNTLPKLKREAWLALMPSLPTSDLTADELRQIHALYRQLEELDSIKGRTTQPSETMDNEREIEELVAALVDTGNPLSS